MHNIFIHLFLLPSFYPLVSILMAIQCIHPNFSPFFDLIAGYFYGRNKFVTLSQLLRFSLFIRVLYYVVTYMYVIVIVTSTFLNGY